MDIARREFIKQTAAAAAAAAAGIPFPAAGQNVVTDATLTQLKWSKAPCRFCGVGCGVNVAVKDNRVVATHGDINAEVNKVLSREDVKASWAKQGATPLIMSPAEFDTYLRGDIEKWAKVIKTAGIKIQ